MKNEGILALGKTYNKNSPGAPTPEQLQLHAVRYTVTYFKLQISSRLILVGEGGYLFLLVTTIAIIATIVPNDIAIKLPKSTFQGDFLLLVPDISK